MDYETIRAECTAIDAQIVKLQRMIKKIPGGEIICTNSGKYSKWYEKSDNGLIYIDKSRREYAERLVLKKFYSMKLRALEQEKQVREWFLKHYDQHISSAPDTLFASRAYCDLLSASIKPRQLVEREWLDSPFEKCRDHMEQLTRIAPAGIYVRSKSEVEIASALFNHKIPFRYECMLNLGEAYFFPDFTIMHPKTHKLIYWEHFGIMDDPQYIRKTAHKIEIYALHNIVPSINLITTYETLEHPLAIDVIENMIDQFFR